MRVAYITKNGIKITDIENELPVLQKMVDGYIEAISLSKDVVALVDEEAKLKGKSPTYSIPFQGCALPILGDFIICGVEQEEFRGLTDPEIATVQRLVRPCSFSPGKTGK